MVQSFRSRLVLSNLLITLLGLLIVGLVFTQLLINRSTEVKKEDRRLQARGVAQQVERFFASPQSRAKNFQTVLRRDVDLAAHVLGVRIIVTTKLTGLPVLDSNNVFRGVPRPLDREAFRAGRAATRRLFRDSSLVFFQAPLRGHAHRQVIGAVVLIARVQDVRPTWRALLQLALTVLGSALLVWFAISIYFAISISRPLARVIAATDRMAGGDYSTRVRLKGRSELSRLGASFNEMAEKVQDTDRVLRDFVANVSHDLRTPLTMIAGFSDAMLDGTAGPNEVEASAGIISEEAAKMRRLVDDLLQLTRLESGLLKLQVEPVELRPLVGTLLHRVALGSESRALPELINAVPDDLPPVLVDPPQFERALRNLVDNAVEYTDAGGRITVMARTHGPRLIEVAVQDSGRGIPAAELVRIFERFYRASKSRERSQGHAGLGLAIVQEIVEAHGGRVSVESVEGRGTTFRLTVPVARARRQRESGAPVEGTRAPAGRS